MKRTGEAMEEMRATVAVVRTDILPKLSANLDETEKAARGTNDLIAWVQTNVLPLGTLACAMLLWGLRKKIASGLVRLWRGKAK